MPRRLPRFFPVSVDRNDDGEVWELTDTFGDRALRIWDEFLSLAEKTNNEIPWSGQQLAAVSRKVRQSLAKVRRTIGWMVAKHWLEVGQTLADGSPTILRLRNYVKYHPIRGALQIPSRDSTVSPLPSEPSEPSEHKIKNGTLKGFEAFWKEYPRKVGKGAAIASWRKITLNNGTGEIIVAAVKQQKGWKAWKEGFIPLPATWLNQTRWLDEGVEVIKSNNPFAE